MSTAEFCAKHLKHVDEHCRQAEAGGDASAIRAAYEARAELIADLRAQGFLEAGDNNGGATASTVSAA